MGKDAPLHSNKSRTSEPMTAETNNKESNSSRANSSKTNNQTSTSSTGSSSESSSHGASDSKTFEFVLVTDAQSRRQVRRHAMRQYMRQRRQDDIARLEPSRVSTGGWSKAAEHSRPLKVQEIGDGDAAVERDACSSGDSLVKPEGKDFGGFRTLTALEKFSFSDPMATPSSSAIYDPFNSYPISMKPADHSLIHHFVVTYPFMMYKMGGTKQGNPMEEIFRRFALHDPLPFEAMLSIAAKHLAGVEGQKDSVQSLTHKMRALRMVNERLQSDTGVDRDSTIYAAATLAVIEKWSKDAKIERMHVKGLSYLIRRRGGMRGMRSSSPFLESVLYWVDFSCAAKAITSANLPLTGNIPDSPPSDLEFIDPNLQFAIPYTLSSAEDTDNTLGILRACEDFLTFFRYLYGLQQSLLRSPPPPLTPSQETDTESEAYHRCSFFDPSTPLYTILTTLPDHDHGIRDVRFIDEYTCLACLLYLNLALYDCYKTSKNFDNYLEWLINEIKRVNPYANPSIASVMWLFLNNGGFASFETQDTGERSWVVSRMLRVAKRLEWKLGGTLWDRLCGVLLEFLTTQQECGLGCVHVGKSELYARGKRLSQPENFLWDEDKMRREILGDLYAGPPLYTSEVSQADLSSLYTRPIKLEEPVTPQLG